MRPAKPHLPRGARRDDPRAQAVVDEAVRSFLDRHREKVTRGVVVVIPALDERQTIPDVVASIPPHLPGPRRESPTAAAPDGPGRRPVCCLVVDDGSTDGTAEAAEAAGALVCRLARNLGQGRALRAGYLLARALEADYIVTLDADGQFDPGEMHRLVAPLDDGRADFVNGSRRLGREMGGDALRAFGITVFGAVVTMLIRSRVTDPANGFRAFRSEVVASVPLRQVQYQTPELLIGAARSGFRVIEAPVTVYARRSGASKKGPNLAYGYRFARTIVSTWLRFTLPGPVRRRARLTARARRGCP